RRTSGTGRSVTTTTRRSCATMASSRARALPVTGLLGERDVPSARRHAQRLLRMEAASTLVQQQDRRAARSEGHGGSSSQSRSLRQQPSNPSRVTCPARAYGQETRRTADAREWQADRRKWNASRQFYCP